MTIEAHKLHVLVSPSVVRNELFFHRQSIVENQSAARLRDGARAGAQSVGRKLLGTLGEVVLEERLRFDLRRVLQPPHDLGPDGRECVGVRLPVSRLLKRGRSGGTSQIASCRLPIHPRLHRRKANAAAIVKRLHEVSVLVLGDQGAPA